MDRENGSIVAVFLAINDNHESRLFNFLKYSKRSILTILVELFQQPRIILITFLQHLARYLSFNLHIGSFLTSNFKQCFILFKFLWKFRFA